ncbi:Shedu anti-phage system protein SduA domain-containing protein [Asanoa siamensis]|uniref:Shedu protein SduA C-terminal domain-containing protein n=1 Tax=Asanoa siamensis TaxID=926357 RepID=A0ABQ4D033_9ACTN|nr:Shedu anti-phage system protein SduA domain-containing protein [Asanoa siamensis]GIF76885.1 hypothetical protein Asi02nite_64030 [Asanoa siamensis]
MTQANSPGPRRDVVQVERIESRLARNGIVTYLPTRVLRSKRYLIQAIAWIVPHSTSSAELVLRLERIDTTKPMSPKNEISLSESEVHELLKYVDAAAAIRNRTPGSYALIRVDDVAGDDSIDAAAALAKILSMPQMASVMRQPEVADIISNSIDDAVRLSALRRATDQLGSLLESGQVAETIYQDWLEAHTWALGNVYVRRDAVRRVSAADDIDILVESALNGLRDVYELKRPDATVLNYDREHKCFYWAHQITKAIGQCHRYLDVLHDKLRGGLDDHPEIVAYHPRAVIIAGRSSKWTRRELHALHGLNARLHGITVMTYDQLLAQCRALLGSVDRL